MKRGALRRPHGICQPPAEQGARPRALCLPANTARNLGFTLTEIVLALGIFAIAGLALVGLLGTGLNVSQSALADAEVTMLVENVQARLTLDPNWPGDREAVCYDNSGVELPPNQEAAASFRVTFTRITGPGFDSDYLDTLRIAIERVATKQPLPTWMLQRARLDRGKPKIAE